MNGGSDKCGGVPMDSLIAAAARALAAGDFLGALKRVALRDGSDSKGFAVTEHNFSSCFEVEVESTQVQLASYRRHGGFMANHRHPEFVAIAYL
jgi:hypothetical protein